MKIQILGSGCAKCNALEQNAREALAESTLTGKIEKVTDVNEIIDMGVMVTPALVINGDVKSSGKVLSKEDILNIISE